MRRLTSAPTRARGLSTLVILLGLFLLTALATAYANRHLLIEQRMARVMEDDARAQAAAAWGAERALGLLNTGAIDDRCQIPHAGGAGTPAAERWLRRTATGPWTLLPASAAMVCDASADEGWACRCAGPGQSVPLRDTPSQRAQSLRVDLQVMADHPDVLRLVVLGCAQGSAECRTDLPQGSIARQQARHSPLQQHLGWLPALRQLPASALLVQGAVYLGDGLLLSNDDPSTQGLALHAGGAVSGSTARLVGRPGSLPAERWLSRDPSLQGLGDDGLRRRLFGRRAGADETPPGLHRIACAVPCTSEVVTKAWQRGHRWVQVDGDLEIDTPVDWGDASRPLLLSVEGRLRWSGGGRFVGALLVGGDAHLDGQAWQAEGALVVSGALRADRQGRVRHDRAVLLRLQREAGSFVRLPGGRWLAA